MEYLVYEMLPDGDTGGLPPLVLLIVNRSTQELALARLITLNGELTEASVVDLFVGEREVDDNEFGTTELRARAGG